MENIINEEAARRAKSANSFSDYKTGSATASYQSLLSQFTAAVDELKSKSNMLEAEKEEKLELVDYYTRKYASKLAAAINRENEISARVPSVMICGAGNFPVRKKEKQIAALDKFFEECGELFDPTGNYYYKKIRNILIDSAIYMGDRLAIEKLENKLSDLTEKQDEMKEANAYYRKNKTMRGYKELTDEQAVEVDTEIKAGYSWQQLPYPSFKLTNNNGAIKQTRDRLEYLKKEKASEMVNEYDCAGLGFEVKENKEIMRLQLLFNGKPDEDIRNLLKSNGFIYAPSQSAWQRQLTTNARYALKRVIKQLNTTARP